MKKREVLEQLKAGTISSEEALKMLDDLEKGQEETVDVEVEHDSEVVTPKLNKKPKWLIIKVIEGKGDKVNIKLPLAVAKFAKKLNISGIDELQNLNYNDLMNFVSETGGGKFVDIKTSKGEVVEIYVEQNGGLGHLLSGLKDKEKPQ